MKALIFAAAIAVGIAVPASAQMHQRTVTTTTTNAMHHDGDGMQNDDNMHRERTVERHTVMVNHDRGRHNGWRNHRHCRTVWRHHRRVRTCW